MSEVHPSPCATLPSVGGCGVLGLGSHYKLIQQTIDLAVTLLVPTINRQVNSIPISEERPSPSVALPLAGGCVILGPGIRSYSDYETSTDIATADTVWRGASTSPDEARAAGGLRPPGRSASLWSHVNGYNKGSEGYVSTSVDRTISETRLEYHYQGEGWLYKVAVAPNMVDVNGILRHFSPYQEEVELSALGGIAYDQIMSWTPFTGGKKGKEVLNPDYNPEKYRGKRSAGIQPHLAGFPADHEAWGLDRWSHLSVCEMSDEIVALLPDDEVVPLKPEPAPIMPACPESEWAMPPCPETEWTVPPCLESEWVVPLCSEFEAAVPLCLESDWAVPPCPEPEW